MGIGHKNHQNEADNMKNSLKAVKISDRVYWVGAIDWSVRDFHGYNTQRGTTYNAYLVLGDKVTLIDGVKAPFYDELMARISSVIDPGKIDYLVSNHTEMDHSGCLAKMIEQVKPEQVFASPMGQKTIDEHYKLGHKVTAVKDGERLDLGGCHLSFLETRMLHWPDSMFSYLEEEKILFSSDAFGMHLASTERYDDELDWHILEWEARKYYANILLLYSPLVGKLLERVGELGLEIDLIAPDHGPIWRGAKDKILDCYTKWSRQEKLDKALVVYDTMWGSTDLMARAIGEGLASGGTEAKLMPLKGTHRTTILTQLLDAGALLVGSPTLNNDLLPTVGDILIYMRGLKPRNVIGASFGSYGWSGESIGQISEMLTSMKIEVIAEGARAKYVPDGEDLAGCYKLGQQVSERLKAGTK
jgi:flavorubredoxin